MRAARRIATGFVLAAVVLGAGCARVTPAPPPTATTPPAVPAPATVELPPGPDLLGVLAYSLSLQGKPYHSGGETPAQGFDCSGFVRYVYRQLGVELPRDTATMAAAMPPRPVDERRPGDLVFFNTTGRSYSHVGIYLGDERFIHAPSRHTGKVMVSSFGSPYWQQRFDGLRRP
ncbi:MAG: C40 family peptidase [Gammaproteobacteria bacterium]|nr:C40 family peptidase [Gammaproteobacteria bacterium]